MTTNGEPNWLTGLFFDITGSPELEDGIADPGGIAEMVTFDKNGSQSYNAFQPGHFWGFRQDLAGDDGLHEDNDDEDDKSELPFGQQYGLSAVGLEGLFEEDDMLLEDGPPPGGVDGGILPGSDAEVPPGQYGVPFVLGSLAFHFDLPEGDYVVDNVEFLFGSGFGEVILIPLPLALPMGIAGLVALMVLRLRSRSARGQAV